MVEGGLATARQDRLAWALLALAIALALFLLVPPFLTGDVGSVSGFTWQEAADLFTPVIVMVLAALVVDLTGRRELTTRLLLVAIAAAWVEGHGIHLAANAIGDVFAAGAERHLFYETASGPLDHFLDEGLGHWLWHAAWLALLALILWAAATGPMERDRPSGRVLGIAALAGLIHGVVWFIVTDEGATWSLAIVGSVALLAAGGLAVQDRRLRVVPTFIAVGCTMSLVLYAGWIVIEGFPPSGFCDLLGC